MKDRNRRKNPPSSFAGAVASVAARVLAGLLAGGLLLGLWPAPGVVLRFESVKAEVGQAASDPLKRYEEIKRQIGEYQQKIAARKKQEKSLAAQVNEIDQALEAYENRLAALNNDLALTRRQAYQAGQELAAAQKRLDQATKDLDAQAEILGRRLRAIYETGGLNYLEFVFTATDFSDFILRMEFFQRFVDADIALYKDIEARRQEVARVKLDVEAKKRNLDDKQKRIATLKAQQQSVLAETQRKRNERATLLAKTQSERRYYEEALDELLKASKEMEARIRAQQAKSTVPGTNERFIRPVSGPITSYFGLRQHPVLGVRKMHTGIDFGVPTGTTVRAAASGEVLLAEWVSGYGKTVVIDHGNGLSTLYAHNSMLLVSAGQPVKQGQAIAKSGATGLASGPNVHFEVRKNGTPVDPLPWLPR